MGKRGPKPKGKVVIRWSANFAYAIGLIATDGNLSPDGRHISFTSKDHELAKKFQHALGVTGHIGKKARGREEEKKYFVVQFSDVLFYNFLLSIGLTPRKSKTIAGVDIPKKYFFHFLRGLFDGDGTFYSYWDPRWRSSFMYYCVFVSASERHIIWLRRVLYERVGVRGHITRDGRKQTFHLKYAKRESWKIIKKMYDSPDVVYLERKRRKIIEALKGEKGKILTK